MKINKSTLLSIAVCIVVVVVVAVVLVTKNNASNNDSSPLVENSEQVSNTPKETQSTVNVNVPTNKNIYNNGIVIGKNGASVEPTLVPNYVEMNIYYDYMCPACNAFEEHFNSELLKQVNNGSIKLILHPLNMLDEASQNTRYPTRAANDIYYVSQNDPDNLWKFHQALFKNQPKEGTTGLTDKQIANIAATAGVKADVIKGFTALTYDGYVSKNTNEILSDSSFTGTPTIKMNLVGKEPNKWEEWSRISLSDAIKNVQNNKTPDSIN